MVLDALQSAPLEPTADQMEMRQLQEIIDHEPIEDLAQEMDEDISAEDSVQNKISGQFEDLEFFGDGEVKQILGAVADEDEMYISTEILIMIFMLMLAITFGHYLKKSGHKYLQESGLTVILGMIAGGLLKLLAVEDYMTQLSTHFSNIFMILLLPPIIFESGYNMNKKPFFKNFGTVLAYSFLGTFIAIFTSSVLFWVVG